MARTTGPKCKQCRAEGMKLFLKGARCESSKCPFSGSGSGRGHGPSRPGEQTGRRRRRMTEYARQLREKQKLKRYYGVLDRQFNKYFDRASSMKGNAGVNLLVLLETRLDNAVHLSGLASSISQARQYISHGLLFSNGKRVDIPSYSVSEGEEFEVKPASDQHEENIKENILLAKNREQPSWIDTSEVEKNYKFAIGSMPVREDISVPVDEHLVIELCSK